MNPSNMNPSMLGSLAPTTQYKLIINLQEILTKILEVESLGIPVLRKAIT